MASEAQILDSFKKGKLELFYNEVYPSLLMYAKKILEKDRDMYAEDCVQNVIFKVWVRQDDLQTVCASLISLKIYLYMCIRNEVLNLRRKQSHHTRYLSQLEDPVLLRNSIIESEVRAAVFEAVRKLPEKEQKIVVMSYLDGKTNAEIAEQLGISLASVKRYKAKGLDILRKKLDPLLFLALIQFMVRNHPF